MDKNGLLILSIAPTAARVRKDIDFSPTLLLVLVTLILILLLGLAVYLVVWRLIQIHGIFRQLTIGQILDEADTYCRYPAEPDLYQQTLTEQQWLWGQLLSQSQEDAILPDFSDHSDDLWG